MIRALRRAGTQGSLSLPGAEPRSCDTQRKSSVEAKDVTTPRLGFWCPPQAADMERVRASPTRRSSLTCTILTRCVVSSVPPRQELDACCGLDKTNHRSRPGVHCALPGFFGSGAHARGRCKRKKPKINDHSRLCFPLAGLAHSTEDAPGISPHHVWARFVAPRAGEITRWKVKAAAKFPYADGSSEFGLICLASPHVH